MSTHNHNCGRQIETENQTIPTWMVSIISTLSDTFGENCDKDFWLLFKNVEKHYELDLIQHLFIKDRVGFSKGSWNPGCHKILGPHKKSLMKL